MHRFMTVLLIFTMCPLPLFSYGQDQPESDLQSEQGQTDLEQLADAAILEPDQSADETALYPIEEIIVTTQRTLVNLKFLIEDAEDDVIGIFNENNSSDAMDIVCRQRVRTGTNISKRECEPRFLREARVRETRNFRSATGVYLNDRDLQDILANAMDQMQAEIYALIAENEDYAKALAEYADLVGEYEARRSAYFDKDD